MIIGINCFLMNNKRKCLVIHSRYDTKKILIFHTRFFFPQKERKENQIFTQPYWIMKYSVFVAPCLRLLQQEAECPEESEEAHLAVFSVQCAAVLSRCCLCCSFICASNAAGCQPTEEGVYWLSLKKAYQRLINYNFFFFLFFRLD